MVDTQNAAKDWVFFYAISPYNIKILLSGAAGNNGDGNLLTDEIYYPGYYPEVIQVGAINDRGDTVYLSNSNDRIDVLALLPSLLDLSTFCGNK